MLWLSITDMGRTVGRFRFKMQMAEHNQQENEETYLERLRFLLLTHGVESADIAECVSYATRLLDNDMPVIFDKDHLALLLGISKGDLGAIVVSQNQHYSRWHIDKKTGGKREIDSPSPQLKLVQRWILDHIVSRFHVSPHAFGFVKGRSIVDNAQAHVGKRQVLTMDVKDFFPSVKFESVLRLFAYYGYTAEVSYQLASLSTLEGCLPQGAPTSPGIANTAFLKADKRLAGLAEAFHATYTRYADDLTFSSDDDLHRMIQPVADVLANEGYGVNWKKTRIAKSHERQLVTGLIVNNEKVRVNRDFKRNLSKEIYYCRRYGVDGHMQYNGYDKRYYRDYLYGKAFFIQMVEPDEGKRYLDYLNAIDWGY